MKPIASLVAVSALVLASSGASAQQIDPAESPYLDVIETTGGSVWRGVLVEQIPGKTYKIVLAGGSVVVVPAEEVVRITKERNPSFKAGGTSSAGTSAGSRTTLAIPLHEGLRLGAATGFAFFIGDDTDSDALLAFAAHGGWELQWSGLSLTPGARLELIRIPAAYYTYYYAHVGGSLQLAGRSGRLAPHGELGLGVDAIDDATGFAVQMGGGLDLVLSPAISLTSEVAYHRVFGFGEYDVPTGLVADVSFVKILVGVTWSR